MVAYMEMQKQLTNLIKDVNRIILHNENDDYKSKKHLIDDIDNCFEKWVKKYNLDLEDKDNPEMDEEALNIIKRACEIKTSKGQQQVLGDRK